jgi:DNA-directed RNA polymerase subunit RPC12/RpoP
MFVRTITERGGSPLAQTARVERRFRCIGCGLKWFIPDERPSHDTPSACAACGGRLAPILGSPVRLERYGRPAPGAASPEPDGPNGRRA